MATEKQETEKMEATVNKRAEGFINSLLHLWLQTYGMEGRPAVNEFVDGMKVVDPPLKKA